MRLALVVLTLTVSACVSASPEVSSSPTRQETLRLFSLLANNHLLVTNVASGSVSELTLGTPPTLTGQLRALVVATDAHTLYVLVTDAGGTARIALIDTTRLEQTGAIDLAGDFQYRGLALGLRSGRLYVFANQRGDAVVQVVDPKSKQLLQTWPARKSEGRDWYIYQGAVAADETALFLSYHGPDTTGIDRFEIQQAGLIRCVARAPRPESGCFVTHGSFTLTGSGVVASMGDLPLAVLDPMTGERREQYDLKLDGNHMPEFAIASRVARMYAVGSCGYTGGLSVVDLATNKTEVIAESRRIGVICGERIVAPSDGSVLVIARTEASVPSDRPGALVVLSPDGKVLRTIPTSAEPIDLLLL